MRLIFILCMSLVLAPAVALAEDAVGVKSTPDPEAVRKEQPGPAREAPQQGAPKAQSDVQMSGMSILGNEEAPKSLVIVPWKSSQLGDMPGLSKLLDDSTQPVDKEVFMRELAYYQIKSDSN